ncbi:YTH domain family protein 1, partial [Trichinella pseudospiralis]
LKKNKLTHTHTHTHATNQRIFGGKIVAVLFNACLGKNAFDLFCFSFYFNSKFPCHSVANASSDPMNEDDFFCKICGNKFSETQSDPRKHFFFCLPKKPSPENTSSVLMYSDRNNDVQQMSRSNVNGVSTLPNQPTNNANPIVYNIYPTNTNLLQLPVVWRQRNPNFWIQKQNVNMPLLNENYLPQEYCGIRNVPNGFLPGNRINNPNLCIVQWNPIVYRNNVYNNFENAFFRGNGHFFNHMKHITDEVMRSIRFFVIRAQNENEIALSVNSGLWWPTEEISPCLNVIFNEQAAFNSSVYLLVTFNSGAYFCGVAKMLTSVYLRHFDKEPLVISRFEFQLKWLLVKAVPNEILNHIMTSVYEQVPITMLPNGHEVFCDNAWQFMDTMVKF